MNSLQIGTNINRHFIANYLADVWGEDIDEYQDWSNIELIKLIKDMNKYDEFIKFIS